MLLLKICVKMIRDITYHFSIISINSECGWLCKYWHVRKGHYNNPRTVPCCTPLDISLTLERATSTATAWIMSFWKSCSHLGSFWYMPSVRSLRHISFWSNLSKTFAKIMYITSTFERSIRCYKHRTFSEPPWEIT